MRDSSEAPSASAADGGAAVAAASSTSFRASCTAKPGAYEASSMTLIFCNSYGMASGPASSTRTKVAWSMPSVAQRKDVAMATVEAATQALTASLRALPSTPAPTWSTDEPRSSSRGRARAASSGPTRCLRSALRGLPHRPGARRPCRPATSAYRSCGGCDPVRAARALCSRRIDMLSGANMSVRDSLSGADVEPDVESPWA